LNVLVAFIPAVVLGLAFGSLVKQHLFHPVPVALAFIVGGLIILWVERHKRLYGASATCRAAAARGWRRRRHEPVADALKVGLVQCLALVPGTSRSGATIIGAWCSASRAAAPPSSASTWASHADGRRRLFGVEAARLAAAADLPMFAVGLGGGVLQRAAVHPLADPLRVQHDFTVFAWYRIVFGGGWVVLLTASTGWVSWSALNTRSRTPWPRRRPRARTWSAAGSRAAARSRRRCCQHRLGRQHLQHLLGIGFPVGGAVQQPPGASRLASSATSAGWIRRRLWCRFLCQGSGKNTCTPASEAGATICCSTSTASCCTMRRLPRPRSPICAAARPRRARAPPRR
jgi:undecaprenyl-diphosphatase